jgi:5-methylcytosine-specific restriction endonuclease McrA
MSSPTKARPKRSAIWNIDEFELREIIKKSNSISEILKHFDLSNKGGNYKTLQKRLLRDNIDISHIQLGLTSNKGRAFKRDKIPLETILTIGSTYNRSHLKERLLKEGILKNECVICGQLPTWNGKPLSLQIDHINGISDDNRLENLRILCPHCHSQTESFAGRNKHSNK